MQRFSRPDRYLARCGHLDAVVTDNRISGAPPFMRELRAVFVADTHVVGRTTQADLDAFMDRIAALEPRLLLLGGDYSDTAEGCVRFFKSLGRLSFPLGCYGVLGNNDAEAWANRAKGLRAVMAEAGCRLLVNQFCDIPYNGGVIRLGGVDEHRYGHPRGSAVGGAQKASDRYRILLSHYPIMPERRPDLMLSGHTHGGQFNLFGLTPYTIGFERLKLNHRPTLAVSGLHDIDGMKLLVSKGVGASRLQLRIGVQPEINQITFE